MNLAIFLASALLLFGCASNARRSNPSDFVALADGRTQQEVKLLVASTRSDNTHVASNPAHFSMVDVSVPPNHRAGIIERGTFAHITGHDFAVSSRRDLDHASFLEEISERASIGGAGDVLLYVHGYDINLNEAIFRNAQIIVDSRFTGIPVLFTWDSLSRSGLAAYEADKESATVARDALESLIIDLSNVRNVRRVHILAHSMGAWLAMESLRGIAISGHPDLDSKLGEVMLAAPDIDVSVFSQQLQRLDPGHVTVFVSNSDRALSLSSRVAGNRPRVGALDPSNPDGKAALGALGVNVRDISRLNSDFMGHNTFADVPSIVSEIGNQLAVADEAVDASHLDSEAPNQP
jgi:esterase/lipase superfamily enzyme